MRKYIGIPYKHLGRDLKGLDCYGLVVMIYKHHLGIELPDVELYTFGEDACNYMTSFYTDKTYENVSGFSKLWTPVTQLAKYDIILFTVYEDIDAPTHSGVYLDHNKFIHCMSGLPVTISRLEGPWKNKMHSAYRYKERLNLDGSI
jgi:cell wall-associated NlpC family hydrolase